MGQGYAEFTMKDRSKYCSKKKFKNHDGAATWASAAIKSQNLKANDMSGKVRWPVSKQDSKATVV
jgi:hypothetical protein